MRLLVVEDEVKLAQTMKKGLQKEGYAVDYVTDGLDAEKRISLNHQDYDLVVLDLMLPNMDGLEICRSLRQQKINLPVLMLTARDGVDDKVMGLDSGADDYLTKPFDFKELLARVRSLLRRPVVSLPTTLSVSEITLDTATKKATYKGEKLSLTAKEISLLEYFMTNSGNVLNREQIISRLWGFDYDSFSNIVDVHIKNLRKKLKNAGQEDPIETVKGIGYRLKA